MTTQHYSTAWLCAILYIAFGMDLHYLTIMGRNVENMKKLTLVRRMNSVDMNSKNIMNSVSISNDNVAMNTIGMNGGSYE